MIRLVLLFCWLAIFAFAGCNNREPSVTEDADHTSSAESSQASPDSIETPLHENSQLVDEAEHESDGPDSRGFLKPKTIREPQFGEPRKAFRPEEADSEENVERFGEFVWHEVHNDTTLFFHRGQYIDAPYVVSTRGLAVFVNDHQVHAVEWPDANYLDEKPELPAGLTVESTPHDMVRGRRLRETWPVLHARWVNTHFAPRPREKREQELLRRYKELPFVTETGVRVVKDDFVGERRIFWFRTNTGEEKGIVSRSTVPGDPPKKPELVLKDLHAVGNYYRQIIQSSDLEYRDGNLRTTVPRNSRAWLWLPEVIDVLDSESTPSNKERKLRVLLNSDSGVGGAVDFMISAWATEFQTTPQLRQRAQRIRQKRTRSPNWQVPPALPEDVPEPMPEQQPEGPEHEARRNLDTAIAEMIELLEKKDFKNFVERYISPQYRRLYNYKENTELNPEMFYDFDKQPDIVEMYLQNLRYAQQVEPLLEDDKAIFVHWFGRGAHEFHLTKVGRFWYFD